MNDLKGISHHFLSCLQRECEKKKEDKKKEKDADKVERHNNTKVQMLHTGLLQFA